MPCRKGQRHSGHFKKGHDPRRHVTGPYMQKKRISIEMVCQEKAEKALETLMKVIEDDDAPAKDRVNAIHFNFICWCSVSTRGRDFTFQLPPPASPKHRQLAAFKLAPPSEGSV